MSKTKTKTKKTRNWSLYPVSSAPAYSPRSVFELEQLSLEGSRISRGLGRCYGDASLGEAILECCGLDHFLEFDPKTGILRCEAGVSLKDIVESCLPRGWFLPVTPGTQFVTVGGAIAADVHGKNHHVSGSFCDHVLSMDLLLADGRVMECSKTQNPEVFHATCGGMGLTGVILRATIQLFAKESSYLVQKLIPGETLSEISQHFLDYESIPYTVAWLDFMGARPGGDPDKIRGIFIGGYDASLEDLERVGLSHEPCKIRPEQILSVPLDFPSQFLQAPFIKAFNALYYQKNLIEYEHLTDYRSFYYPLDVIGGWNRVYGSAGFLQYQGGILDE